MHLLSLRGCMPKCATRNSVSVAIGEGHVVEKSEHHVVRKLEHRQQYVGGAISGRPQGGRKSWVEWLPIFHAKETMVWFSK